MTKEGIKAGLAQRSGGHHQHPVLSLKASRKPFQKVALRGQGRERTKD